MKKIRTKAFKAVTASFLSAITLFGAVAVMQPSNVEAAEITPGVKKHTQTEIANYFKQKNINWDLSVGYTTAPKAYNTPGVLDSKTKTAGINTVNYFRYIAGISDNVKLDNASTEKAQAGAFIHNISNQTSPHDPVKPSQMNQSVFNLAHEGASKSNLGKGYTTLNRAISGWASDNYASTIGHRTYLFNPYLTSTGLGYSNDSSGRAGSSMYVVNNQNNQGNKEKYVVWPAQQTPVDAFDGADKWSVSSFTTKVDVNKVKINIKNASTGKNWNIYTGSSDGSVEFVESWYSGNALKFIPNGLKPSVGDKYNVTITNLGADTLKYTVEFFDINKPNSGTTSTTPTTPTTPANVQVTGVSFDKTNATVEAGSTVKLTATVSPSNATNKTLTWASSNNNVATVSSSGVVTGKTEGTATITAKSSNGKTASCTVKVTPKKVVQVLPTSVFIGTSKYTAYAGYSATLKATVNPSNATNKNLTWSSSNNNIVTVDANGKFTIKKSGTATITARTVNGKTSQCTIVSIPYYADDIKLDKTAASVKKGGTVTLKATLVPADTTYKTISWSSSNPSVASVNNGVVTAKATGTTVITARAQGGKTATCKVTVFNPIACTSVKLNKTTLSIVKGKTSTLTATVLPSNATNKSVTWTSSNPSVATVSGGKITAKSKGSATITVKTSNGKTAKCTVKVTNPIACTSVKLNKTSLSIVKGKTSTLTATVAPSNATNKSVTWTSSNPSVATVSGGKITAKSKGSATITVKTSNGKTAKCKVTVTNPIACTSVKLNKTKLSIAQGSASTLTATVAPSNATNKSVTWTSSNTSVATVSGGKVTAKNLGTAVITVKTSNGKTAKCTVTVVKKPTETYKDVSKAYTVLNNFRTTKSNQWYWNSNNKTKTTTYGLKALKRDVALENVAKQRAKEQWTQYHVNGKATHTRPNGKDCWSAYPASTRPSGECLHWWNASVEKVFLDGTYGFAETNLKYDKQGHRRIMLQKNATRVGIACYEKNGKVCWAVCLGY